MTKRGSKRQYQGLNLDEQPSLAQKISNRFKDFSGVESLADWIGAGRGRQVLVGVLVIGFMLLMWLLVTMMFGSSSPQDKEFVPVSSAVSTVPFGAVDGLV